MTENVAINVSENAVTVTDQTLNLPVTISAESLSVAELQNAISIALTDNGVTIEQGLNVVQVGNEQVITPVMQEVIVQAVNEDAMSYAKRVDFISEDELYTGQALAGTLNADPKWRISLTTIAADGDVVVKWAEGSGAYIHAWDDRASLTYS